MEVYVEYVILDNFVIDYIILSITNKMLKLQCSNKRLLLISFLGVVISLISPFLSGIWLILTKLLSGMLMPLLMLKHLSFKKFILTFLTFLVSTMIMGGACIMICSIFQIEWIIDNGTLQIYSFPIGLALLICLILYFILKNLINQFYTQKKMEKFLYDVTICYLGKKIDCKAFLDSGNRLSENHKPVILINFKTLSKLTKVELCDVLLKRTQKINLKNLHELEVKSIAKSSKILVFEIDNIVIENKNFSNILAGISLTSFESVNADCILSPLMFD